MLTALKERLIKRGRSLTSCLNSKLKNLSMTEIIVADYDRSVILVGGQLRAFGQSFQDGPEGFFDDLFGLIPLQGGKVLQNIAFDR